MKKRYGIIIVIITAIILYIILKDDYKNILELLFSANILWIIVSFLLVLSNTFFRAIIVKNIINKFHEYSFKDAFILQLMSVFFNGITPFASGGQPFQVYELKKNNIRINDGTNVVVQTTIINQISLISSILLVLLINWIFNLYPMDTGLKIMTLTGLLINVCFLTFTALLSLNKKIGKVIIKFANNVLYRLKIVKDKKENLEKWTDTLDHFNKGSKELFKDKFRLFKLIFLNIMAYIISYIIPLTILFSFNNYNAYDGVIAIILTGLVSIIGSFVPLPGGSGGQEYMFMTLFGTYLIDPLLSSVMLLWRFVTYYLPMIIGGIIFNIRGEKKCE